MSDSLIIIGGAILSVLLSINAFLLKQFLDSLNQVKLQTAILIDREASKESRIKEIEVNQKEIFIRLNKVEKL